MIINKIKTENVIIVIISVMLTIIIIFITYTNYKLQQANKKAIRENRDKASTPKPIPTIFYQTIDIVPTIQQSYNYASRESSINIALNNNINMSNVLLYKIQNRIALSPKDEEVKTEILKLLPTEKTYGTVYQSSNVNIDYNDAFNIFEVEIKTLNINSAKPEAVAWFMDQGFSQDAICNYPIEFYLSFNIKDSFYKNNDLFNPLPPNCL